MHLVRSAGFKKYITAAVVLSSLLAVVLCHSSASAVITPIPPPPPGSSSYGLEATKSTPPPADAPHISTPSNGTSFTTSPTTVTGLCKSGLLVEIYDNNVMVGAITCKNGSFSVKVSLFTGKNVFSAIQYDDLNQASPKSNKISVSFNNSHLTSFGQQITLTSNYGRMGADPGSQLVWPLQLSGGTGPYAVSINWGDGKPAKLQSLALSGKFNISHVYDQSGIYQVTVRVTDKNGVSAFLQLVGIGRGQPANTKEAKEQQNTIVRVIWIPAVIALILLGPAYWLGRHSELVTLHRKLEEDFNRYEDAEKKTKQ